MLLTEQVDINITKDLDITWIKIHRWLFKVHIIQFMNKFSTIQIWSIVDHICFGLCVNKSYQVAVKDWSRWCIDETDRYPTDRASLPHMQTSKKVEKLSLQSLVW